MFEAMTSKRMMHWRKEQPSVNLICACLGEIAGDNHIF